MNADRAGMLVAGAVSGFALGLAAGMLGVGLGGDTNLVFYDVRTLLTTTAAGALIALIGDGPSEIQQAIRFVLLQIAGSLRFIALLLGVAWLCFFPYGSFKFWMELGAPGLVALLVYAILRALFLLVRRSKG